MKHPPASLGLGRIRPVLAAALAALLVAHGMAVSVVRAEEGAREPATNGGAKLRRARPSSVPASPAASLPAIQAGDLTRLSSAELEELIAEQRRHVPANPRDETVRRNLGWISMEAANRILQAEALGRMREASTYVAMIRASLVDTLWRVTQLARQEPSRGLAALGVFHAEGILAPKQAARACDEFAKAAALGHAAAAYRASLCVAKTDPKAARRWLEQSAGAGHAGAQEAMGRACLETSSVDLACAGHWLGLAAAQGRISAMSLLAWVYAREGTDAALSRAATLYRVAAETGDLAAQNNLGEFHETGRGVPRDTAIAIQWYRRSAEQGFGPAQFNLARLLAFGMGTERDTVQARDWATKAQAQGIAQADELLRLLSDSEKRR